MISILMATYNGEKYLAAQIESLLSQSYQDFVIYIQDDCSVDDTFSIILEYAHQYPQKIVVTRNKKNLGGAKFNFYDMMLKHQDEYVMLCDQDDIWFEKKIEVSLNCIRDMEAKNGKEFPALVHSSLIIVDENLNLMRKEVYSHSEPSFVQQLMHNDVTGCTVMYNKALSNYFVTEPFFMIMHDWWLYLLASAFGNVKYLKEPMIYYRQHCNNSVGATDTHSIAYKVHRLFHLKTAKMALQQSFKQAESFLKVYSKSLSALQINLLDSYCSVTQYSKLRRWIFLWRMGALRPGIVHKFMAFLYI